MNLKLNKIVNVEYTSQKSKVYDIEIDHPDHLFIAKSANRSYGNFA